MDQISLTKVARIMKALTDIVGEVYEDYEVEAFAAEADGSVTLTLRSPSNEQRMAVLETFEENVFNEVDFICKKARGNRLFVKLTPSAVQEA